MGLLTRSDTRFEPLDCEDDSEALADSSRTMIGDLCDDSDRLAATRGQNHSKFISLCFALSIPGTVLSLGAILVPIEAETLYWVILLAGGGLVAIGSFFGFLAFLNQPETTTDKAKARPETANTQSLASHPQS